MYDNPIDNVNNKHSFIKFLEYLHSDFIQHPENWGNRTLDSFLDALASYAEDIQGYYDNSGQKVDSNLASWKVFADLLKGASTYE